MEQEHTKSISSVLLGELALRASWAGDKLFLEDLPSEVIQIYLITSCWGLVEVALHNQIAYCNEALAVVLFITWKFGDAHNDSEGVGLAIYYTVW